MPVRGGDHPIISLYVCPEDRFFRTHFLERAVAARKAGYEVLALAPDTGLGPVITGPGLTFSVQELGSIPLYEPDGEAFGDGIFSDGKQEACWKRPHQPPDYPVAPR